MTARTSRFELSFRDRLARLGPPEAKKILGSTSSRLLREGGRLSVSVDDAPWKADTLRFDVDGRTVTLASDPRARLRIRGECATCTGEACVHVAGAIAFLLEEKQLLGLAAAPHERIPAERLSEDELVERALEERRERASTERMTLKPAKPTKLWGDYTVTNSVSGMSYRVALRGEAPGDSYCTCPDFRKNTLGTCKHLLFALTRLRKVFAPAAFKRPYQRPRSSVHLRYGAEVGLHVAPAADISQEARDVLGPFLAGPVKNVRVLLGAIAAAEDLGHPVHVHPDADEYIEHQLQEARLVGLVKRIRKDPANHPLRSKLLSAELLPYQLDGIAFAVGARRAILADDMGLGKTIQGIGVAELLAREAGIDRVLIVTPASVKAQWAHEIRRFCDRDVHVVLGSSDARAGSYGQAFFTVCNYEQVLRDVDAISAAEFDLIVLDEAQRIKNWEAKTSAAIKRLRSPFALALTGTPLENRIDELYSVVEFIDERRLAPAFRFYNRHRVVDESGRVLGYRDLDALRKELAPVLLRRTRAEVLEELPPRTTEIVRIAPTGRQKHLHDEQMAIVARIVAKRFLTEVDLLRLRQALQRARMAADAAGLVDKQGAEASSKLEELERLMRALLAERGRKIIVFSEWTKMLDRIEPLLERIGAQFVRLDGQVSQTKRRQVTESFQKDSGPRVILMSNAGATGLNLQAADTIVNVDLPWNPALLEQRIGRAHRMGQKRPVQVYLMVTTDTLEERLLGTLAAKHELFRAVLDPDSDLTEIDLVSGVEELRRRLEVLIGAQPDAATVQSNGSGDVDAEAASAEAARRRSETEEASGRLLEAALTFIAGVLPSAPPSAESERRAKDLHEATIQGLARCTERGADGRPRLTVTLQDDAALQRLGAALAQLLANATGSLTGARDR